MDMLSPDIRKKLKRKMIYGIITLAAVILLTVGLFCWFNVKPLLQTATENIEQLR